MQVINQRPELEDKSADIGFLNWYSNVIKSEQYWKIGLTKKEITYQEIRLERLQSE